jgi:SulP family sulfate permease
LPRSRCCCWGRNSCRGGRSRSSWWCFDLLLSLTPLGELGFKIVGALPQGLPDFKLPDLRVRDVDGVIPLAFACLLLAYVESVSAARALAQARGYEIDARQELLGLGAANLAAGLFQAYPVAGGLSQSSVNDKAGARHRSRSFSPR